MPVLLLIAGLVLLIAGGSWFTGAATVGIICLVLAVLFVAIPLLFGGMLMRGASRRMDKMMDGFR